jgi:hypothetical protein
MPMASLDVERLELRRGRKNDGSRQTDRNN